MSNKYWEFIRDFNPRRTWFVAEDGDDATGDGSHDDPWKSIERAYADCLPMDAIGIISLEPGVNDRPVLNSGIKRNILIYNTWESGPLAAMTSMTIRDKYITLAGLRAGGFKNITGGIYLDESLGYPVLIHPDDEAPTGGDGLTIFRCVYGTVIKSAPDCGVALKNTTFCKVIESIHALGRIGSYIEDCYGIHHSMVFGLGEIGMYFIDPVLTKEFTRSFSPLAYATSIISFNYLLDNAMMYSEQDIWDNNLTVPVIPKRNITSTILMSLALEAWGLDHWDDETFQAVLTDFSTEFSITISSRQEWIDFCRNGNMNQLTWIIDQAAYRCKEVVEYFTNYWYSLTENERRSGFLNRDRRNIILKPDVSPYLEEVEDPAHPGDPIYFYVRSNDVYRAMPGARFKDVMPLAQVPPLVGNLFEMDMLADFRVANDINDASGYDLDRLDSLVPRSVLAPVPTSAELCAIYGTVKDLGLTVEWVEKVQLVFEAVLPQSLGPDPSMITKKEAIVQPDFLTGNFSANLARNAKVRVVCQEAGLDAEFTVPDAESAKLVDLITT